ncbi:hypothetical protein HMPREF1011_00479 [Anaerostipes caccae]|nr:hypothetical protein HMPREF1011_00479 [Anaerostipes caccae]
MILSFKKGPEKLGDFLFAKSHTVYYNTVIPKYLYFNCEKFLKCSAQIDSFLYP